MSIDGSGQSTRGGPGDRRTVSDMNASQQHLLDTYRAARRAEAAPPAPGTHTLRTAHEIRGWYRFRAVVTAPADRGAGGGVGGGWFAGRLAGWFAGRFAGRLAGRL